jgi:transposase InsO family protein
MAKLLPRSVRLIHQRDVQAANDRLRIVCSMSRSGYVWHNAAMEIFFSSLKTERPAGKTYRTRNETRAHMFGYIERFHNATPASLDDRITQPSSVRT